jgi:hypothetical protein
MPVDASSVVSIVIVRGVKVDRQSEGGSYHSIPHALTMKGMRRRQSAGSFRTSRTHLTLTHCLAGRAKCRFRATGDMAARGRPTQVARFDRRRPRFAAAQSADQAPGALPPPWQPWLPAHFSSGVCRSPRCEHRPVQLMFPIDFGNNSLLPSSEFAKAHCCIYSTPRLREKRFSLSCCGCSTNGDVGARPLKRPKKRPRYASKSKYLDKAASPARLENAAVNLKYEASPYHCPLHGRPPARRAKPASHCPEGWTPRKALNRLREAVRAGQVSRAWVEDFPRHVWHKEGDMWYEASTQNGTPGTYHAYPIEITGLPPELTP